LAFTAVNNFCKLIEMPVFEHLQLTWGPKIESNASINVKPFGNAPELGASNRLDLNVLGQNCVTQLHKFGAQLFGTYL
jgi:hypothetical protein